MSACDSLYMHVTGWPTGNWASETRTTNISALPIPPTNIKMKLTTSSSMTWTTVICVLAVVFVCSSSFASAYEESHMLEGADDLLTLQRRDHGACDRQIEIKDMCERCAKVTKSPLIYRMCCKNEEDAEGWCEDFLSTGRKR